MWLSAIQNKSGEEERGTRHVQSKPKADRLDVVAHA